MPFKFNPITTKLDLVEDAPIPPVQQSFVTDAGTAISVADSINVLGGANINTAGAVDTVTVALDSAVTTTSYATDNAASGLTIENNTITADGTNANIDIGLIAKGGQGGVYSPTHVTIGRSASVSQFSLAGVNTGVSLLIDNPGTTDALGISELRHGGSAIAGSNLQLGRSRGTFAAPTIVQNGDNIGRFGFLAYDGATYQYAAQIQCNIAAAPGANDTPGNLIFQTTPDGSSTPTTALTISSAQVVTLANALPVGSGGLGITTTPTNGQIPIGNGTNYTAATLSAGSGVSITNAAGSVTIASSGGGTTWKLISANQTLVAGESYLVDTSGGAITLALPAIAVIGDYFRVYNLSGANQVTISQGAGQQVRIASSLTTSGVGGSLTTTSAGDSLEIVCSVANNNFNVVSLIGNITVV